MGNFQAGKPGEPVIQFGTMPIAASPQPHPAIFVDDFSKSQAWNKAWQWSANPGPHWAYIFDKQLRLYPVLTALEYKNLWHFPAWFSQKLPAEQFMATAKINVANLLPGEEAGWGILGTDYARIALQKDSNGLVLQYIQCEQADQDKAEKVLYCQGFTGQDLYLRLSVSPDEKAIFSYSFDGQNFLDLPKAFAMKPGKWVGARLGFFSLRNKWKNDAGFLGIHWIKIEPTQP
jgi:hypothetical protein